MSTVATTANDAARVLIVEDDPDARENLRDILELDDFAVDTAATAAEALAERNWDEVAVVILDRRLPDSTQRDLLPELRRRAPSVAVIVVTGYSDLEGAIDALRLGAADYILKPINADSLRLRVRRVVEQRRLACAKERSDTLFRLLVEVAECMIVMLRPDHSIVYFSPFAERLTGYPASEVLGLNFLHLFVPESDHAAVALEDQQSFLGSSSRSAELRVVVRDGSTRWVLKNARAVMHTDQTPVLLMVAHDITEQKHAQTRMLDAERLAAIGEMMAGLAHESGNALQRSQACLDMLSLKVQNNADALNLITRVRKAQDDLQRLFEDVRNYAAPIKLELRRHDLPSIWREAWTNLGPSRRGRVARLLEHLDDVDLTCVVDPFRLGQVFRNLFDNSLAACPNPAEVVVTAAEATLHGMPALQLSVRDNGPGFNPEARQRVWDSFFTTKTKGTGLGMAIVKRIIEAHGGLAFLGEHDEVGAEVFLLLPRRGAT